MSDEPVLFEELEDQEEFLFDVGSRGISRFRKDQYAMMTSKYPFVNAVWADSEKPCFFKKDAQCFRLTEGR